MTSGYIIYFSESGARKKRSTNTGISFSENMLHWMPDIEVEIISDSTGSPANLGDVDVTPLVVSFFPHLSTYVVEK